MRPQPIIRDIRVIRGFKKGNAGPESIRGRHLVDVQQRLNCALPSHFSELWFLSIPKSSRHVVNSKEFTDLAVDLCLRARFPNLDSSNPESRRQALSP
jgi:hypothetical protein